MDEIIRHLQEAYRLLMRDYSESLDMSMADAIDHTATAIRSLGAEPEEAE